MRSIAAFEDPLDPTGQRMPHPDVMVDLETMGTNPEAPIISIGAVAFNLKEGWVETSQPFYTTIQLGDEVRRGAKIDSTTVLWWMQQSDAARNAITKTKSQDLVSALSDFGHWLSGIKELKIWGNGADFDCLLLQRAHLRANLICPWSFRQHRCYRTMINTLPPAPKPPEVLAHHALQDAIWQAKALTAAWRASQ